MAEFIDVVRAKRRMCKTHTGKCSECKLQENCSLLNVCSYNDDDVKKLENEVMSWAAEHPEPVYPTWFEWFKTIVPDEEMLQRGMYWDMQIPADIAKKLGIEPKEE